VPRAFTTRRTLTKAGKYLLEQLEADGRPVFSDFQLSILVSEARASSKQEKLRMKADHSLIQDFRGLKKNLIASSKVASDQDYRQSAILRLITIPDRAAEDIVCLADPLAYISHLSAMQRWGLTLRVGKHLQISSPRKAIAKTYLDEMMEDAGVDPTTWPIKLDLVEHPNMVRKMPVTLYRSEKLGVSRLSSGSFVRVASVGQTFADMVQEPDLCGGMSHVIEVWEEHAATYLNLIVAAVNSFCSDLGKSRAGYLLEEKLKLSHPLINKWRETSLSGAFRKLDPAKEYSAQTSKSWNLSINV
jgi:hypothetical protein